MKLWKKNYFEEKLPYKMLIWIKRLTLNGFLSRVDEILTLMIFYYYVWWNIEFDDKNDFEGKLPFWNVNLMERLTLWNFFYVFDEILSWWKKDFEEKLW